MAESENSEPHGKRRASAASSRSRLLSAARAVFAERGYDGARVEEISHRARMSPRMLYHYFGSKELLYAAVAHEHFSEVLTSVRDVQLEQRGAPVLQRLRASIGAYLEALHSNDTYLRFAQWESAGGWSMLNTLESSGHSGFEQITQTLLADVEEGISSGILRADLDPAFVLGLSGLLGTYWVAYYPRVRSILGRVPFEQPSSPRAREALVDFFLRGIIATPETHAPGAVRRRTELPAAGP